MATKTSSAAISTISPALSTNTQQPATKAPTKVAAKSPAPKAATTAGKRRKKAPSKKPAAAVAVKISKSDPLSKAKKASKPKKVKMVRDSYTMPENDYARLADLKKTCLKAGVHVKKSELLRAGLNTLAKLPTAALLQTIEGLVKIKTGRPGKH